MNSFKKIVSALVVVAAVAASAYAPIAKAAKQAHVDDSVMQSCLSMSPDELSASTQCASVMSRKNVTAEDVVAIKACKAMPQDAMQTDPTCQAQAAKHPELV